MSSVLRKKFGAGGGIPPTILQCAPFWELLTASVAHWTTSVFALESSPSISLRKVLTGSDSGDRIADCFAFTSLSAGDGAICAVALNRSSAMRYAAIRMHQDASGFRKAPDLFLKLMVERAAQSLWTTMSEALEPDSQFGEPVTLTDLSGRSDALGDSDPYLNVRFCMSGDGDEDGWLLEGDEEPPEMQLVLNIDKVRAIVRNMQVHTDSHPAKPGAGRDTLRKRVRESSVSLDAIIDRLPLTIGECARLEVGQVIALPNVEPGRMTLCAETINGSFPISHGELGVWKGFRALKLDAPVPESVIREIAEI